MGKSENETHISLTISMSYLRREWGTFVYQLVTVPTNQTCQTHQIFKYILHMQPQRRKTKSQQSFLGENIEKLFVTPPHNSNCREENWFLYYNKGSFPWQDLSFTLAAIKIPEKGKPKLNLGCPLNENLMPLEMNIFAGWNLSFGGVSIMCVASLGLFVFLAID